MSKADTFRRFISRTRAAGAAIAGAARMDSWMNTITGMGINGMDKLRAAEHWTSPIHPTVLAHLYSGDDMAARIVDAPIEHAMMLGVEVVDDAEGDILKAAKKWKALDRITSAATWGRLYGGGAVLIGIDRGFMEDPLDLETVQEGDLLYLTVLEREHMEPATWFDDPTDDRFGEVETYMIHKGGPRGGGIVGEKVHADRLIFFGGVRTVQKLKDLNGGWDLSVLQRPYDILRDSGQAWQSFQHLLNETTQAVFKMKGLHEMIAEGEAETMMARMQIVNMARSIARAVVIDAEAESFEHVGAANISGIPQAMIQVWQRLAAAARMPVTILMGMSPSGLNATGDADMRSWFNTIQIVRTDYLQEPIERLLTVIAASEGISQEVKIDWPSLWQMAPPEEAQHKKTTAEVDNLYVSMGALLPEEVTIARWGKGEYSDETASAVDVTPREGKLEDDLDELLNPPPAPVPPPPPAQMPLPGMGPEDPEPDPDPDA